ncbi:MAG: hypothetical protein JWR18_2422 [Segetibacter sp.]|jgi:hypothetical protein|nr:hypothetical protein [Segetibacter sp.]
MKVRISGNNIRFRLKQSEVKTFRQEGRVSQVTAFGFAPDDTLSFTLLASPGNVFNISKSPNAVSVEVPETIREKWTATDMVGFEEKIETGKGKTITVLVEKDFTCLDGSDIENADSYPNPKLQ